MMITSAVEAGGSIGFIVTLEAPEDDDAVPKTVTWSLFDGDGDIVNSREDETESAAAEVPISLNGDDLPFLGATDEDSSYVYLVVTVTYDSTTFGNDRVVKSKMRIRVTNPLVD